jgi:hypothetical protein
MLGATLPAVDVTLCRNGFDTGMLCQQSVAISPVLTIFLHDLQDVGGYGLYIPKRFME